jgi:nucleoside-diphosphate-sugar epimerase
LTARQTILVTGASGFIGGWIVETLHLQGHTNVRAGIRNWMRAPRLARFPLNIVLCDVMDKTQITSAMADATIVIHCVSGGPDVIVQGTNNVLDVALKQGVQRVVHLSTTEVYGNVSGEVDEKTPLQSRGTPYGDAKIEADQLCWQYYKQGLAVTVVRPPIVYGPFSRNWTLRVAQKLQSGNWGLFEGYGDGFCNLVYVSDIVDGILLAARHEGTGGEAFNINGAERVTWNEYWWRLNAALGFPDLKVIKPSSSKLRAAILQPARTSAKFMLNHFAGPIKKVYGRSRAARGLMRRAEKSMTTTVTLEELNSYSRKAIYLTSKAQKILGYQPRFNLDIGLQMSVGWLRLLGVVNSEPQEQKSLSAL